MANRTTLLQRLISGAQPRCHSVVSFSVFCHAFFFLCPQHVPKRSLLISHLCFPEELCLELARAIEAGDTRSASQHASALARQKAVLTIQLSQKNYADGEIRWRRLTWKGLVLSFRLLCVFIYNAIFVFQFVCGGGGRFFFLLCHSESLPLHDRGGTQATGQKAASW